MFLVSCQPLPSICSVQGVWGIHPQAGGKMDVSGEPDLSQMDYYEIRQGKITTWKLELAISS